MKSKKYKEASKIILTCDWIWKSMMLDATKEVYLTVFRGGKTFWGKVNKTRYNRTSNSVAYILSARDF